MRTLDEPESPDYSPDGKRVVFAAMQDGVGDIFVVDLADEGHHQPHQGQLSPTRRRPGRPTASPSSTSRASAATRSCSGSICSSGRKTQLTFGTHDDGAAQWLDADTLVFASTATDPSQPIDPDVARNGKIYNIWTLSLKTGELQAVHRRRRRQPVCGGPEGRRGHAAGSASSPTTRASTSCTRSSAATRSSPRRRPTSARPARTSSTSSRRCRTRWSPTRKRRRARSRRCSWTGGRRSTSA